MISFLYGRCIIYFGYNICYILLIVYQFKLKAYLIARFSDYDHRIISVRSVQIYRFAVPYLADVVYPHIRDTSAELVRIQYVRCDIGIYCVIDMSVLVDVGVFCRPASLICRIAAFIFVIGSAFRALSITCGISNINCPGRYI